MFRRCLVLPLVGAALALLAIAPLRAAQLPYVTGVQEASQLQAALNQLIGSINSGVAGLVSAQTGAVGTGADTTEDTMQQYTLPGGTLATAGQSIRVRCWGTTGADINNKSMKLYFGGSSVATPVAATNAKGWFLELLVMKTGANAQSVLGQGTVDVTPVSPVSITGTDVDTAGVLIKCTGTNGTAVANDVLSRGMTVEVIK